MTSPAHMANTPCATVNPELFFPSTGNQNGVGNEAKAICATCTVRVGCLDYAMADPTLYGVWGGLTEVERDKLRKASA